MQSVLKKDHPILTAAQLDTSLGPMIAIADEKALYLLAFLNQKGLDKHMISLKEKAKIVQGTNALLKSLEKELVQYFKGKLTEFKTPLLLLGTDFQKKVWQQLKKICYGQTQSYLDIAKLMQHPLAFRAVASANAANPIAIVIPCHRVIHTSGKLGGYAGSVTRKQKLLAHEGNYILR